MSWESPLPEFEGLDLTKLGTDQAYLRPILSQAGSWLYSRSDDCHSCPWQRLGGPLNLTSNNYKVSSHHMTHLLAMTGDGGPFVATGAEEELKMCTVSAKFGEFGVYDLSVGDNCRLTTALEPVSGNLALLVMFIVFLAGALLWWGLSRVPGDPLHKVGVLLGWSKGETGEKGGKVRLRSLDTFRGISIVIMIFVNDGGGGYWFMEHATWNGLYVADLVFPWFLWVMGVCIPMSVASYIKKEIPTRTVVWQVTVRSIKLFLLGFILNTLGGWIDLSKLRVPGVLQRFGACYWVVTLLGFSLSGLVRAREGMMGDLVPLLPHWAVVLVLLTIHQLVVHLVPAPGCSPGYAGPGGLHEWTNNTSNNMGCIGGITGYIDRLVLTTPHIYGNPTAKVVYGAGAFDPEGILGCLTSLLQVFLGYQAGQTLLTFPGHLDRLGRWVGWGVLTGGLGALLCGASQEGGWVPVNKNLWSVSFVLVTTSFAFLLLAFLYFLIDQKRMWKGQPFFYAGMNSILLYCGHSVGYSLFPFHFISGPMRTHAAKLPEALWGSCLWVIIAFVLYRKRVFITV